MRHVIAISILLFAATYIALELYRTQHPSLPWVKRRRARRIRWQWARRQPGAAEPKAAVAPTPPAPQP